MTTTITSAAETTTLFPLQDGSADRDRRRSRIRSSGSTDQPRTIADLIAAVQADLSLSPRAKTDEASALKRLCEIIGRNPADLQLIPTEFRRFLDTLHVEQAPLAHLPFRTIKPHTLQNIRSLCRRAFDRYAGQFRVAQAPVSARWQALLAAATDTRQEYQLRRFARFATARGVEPDGVDDQLAAAYRSVLASDPFTTDPGGIYRRTLLAWNRGVAAGAATGSSSGWPQRLLTLTYARAGYCLEWSEIRALSPAFCDDVERFAAYLGRKGGLLAKGPRRSLKPRSIEHRRFQLRQAFSIWHRHSGGEGRAITRLRDLAEPERAAAILEFFLERRDGQATSQSSSMLNLLLGIARHYGKLDDAAVDELRSYRGMVGYTQTGLTKKNRTMLRQFDSERNLGLLLRLPTRVYRKLRQKKRITKQDALAMRNALLIELELMTAMRRGNLARLRSDLHLEMQRLPDGGTALFLDIDARETKNGEPLGYPLPAPAAELLRFYLDICRPVLLQQRRGGGGNGGGAGTGWFFPGQKAGQPLHEDQVSRLITATVFKHTGLTLTAHAFRHLVGMLHLKANPGELEVLRRFYGHRSIDVTANNYVGFDATAAALRVDAQILALRDALPDLEAAR